MFQFLRLLLIYLHIRRNVAFFRYLWLITEIIHRSKNHEQKSQLSVIGVMKKVDTPTIFFFLGILLAVASLQSAGQLDIVAKYLETTFNG